MLGALYLRSLEENYSRSVSLWMKTFMMLPSVLVQVRVVAFVQFVSQHEGLKCIAHVHGSYY